MAQFPGGPPARVLHIREPDVGLEAIVVVDHTIFPVSAGGTRMLPDVDESEVAALARAMTWKFAVYRLPFAGSKAGIRFVAGDRASVIRAFRRSIEPWRDVFLTGPDMGTAAEDFLDESNGPLPFWARSFEGLGMDDLATGHGVKAAAEAALATLDRDLAGASVAIEGFGKVGAGAARAFARAGARVVAMSTVEGALVEPGGHDVDRLLALRERHGDRFVHHASAPARAREEVFATPCDVLVPGARPGVLSRELAERVRCAVVAPAANVPYGAGAADVLHRRGILAVPDFVANAGGVHLYESVREGDDAERLLRRVERLVGRATARVLRRARDERRPPLAAALTAAREFLEESRRRPRAAP